MNITRSKILFLGALSVSALILGVSFADRTRGQSISDEHARYVAANCAEARTSLTRIHRNDTSLRLDRGRQFEFISSKLMARLNGRLALNQFDAGELVSITSKYSQSVDKFRDAYYEYETKLSQVLRIDCQNDPIAFYESVQDTREKRQAVLDRVTEVNNLADDYYEEFNQLRSEYRMAVKGVQDD